VVHYLRIAAGSFREICRKTASETTSDCSVRLFLETLSLYTDFMTSMFDVGDEMKAVIKYD
jgi:hypothetical protein